jgi:tetratricopeptide (TPR) repeat protein
MEFLRALLKIKQNLKTKNLALSDDSKLRDFENILLQSALNEKEICSILYGTDRKTNAYRSLKFRLEEQLINEVFLHAGNIAHDTNYSFKMLVASKNFTVASCLHKYGFVDESINLFKKNQLYCEKNSIIKIAVLNIKTICYHYAMVCPNTDKMHYYLDRSDELFKIFEAENKIEKYNAIISNIYLTKKGGFTKGQLNDIKEMIHKINEIKNVHSSRNINLLAYDLICFYYILINDFEKCIEYATEGLQKLSTLYYDRLFENVCMVNVAVSYFHLKNYAESEKWFLNAISCSPKGGRIWFHHCSKYFTVLIRLKLYEKLIPLYLEVAHEKGLRKYPSIEEEWQIREAIIHLFIKTNRLSTHDFSKLPPFSINKFINNVPFYSKDKSGQFVAINIIKILYLLLQSKYDAIIDLADSLTQYVYKYLKNDETLRSNCFIKMILKMVKAGFHPVRTQAIVKELQKKLFAAKINIDERSSEVEIIPYEDLWEMIVAIIEVNYKKKTK